MPDSDDLLPRVDATGTDGPVDMLREEQLGYTAERPILQSLLNRPFRDRAFRRAVLSAYDRRCAITGWQLINGGGRPEAEAAHIKPVASGGPDSVRNGLALSGTAHWMFDRGLITLADDYIVLVSRQVNNREEVERMINPSGRALVPNDDRLKPHPAFLAWHREEGPFKR
ncbi:MAG: HNH endonuclease [Pseudomonadota bacterium]